MRLGRLLLPRCRPIGQYVINMTGCERHRNAKLAGESVSNFGRGQAVFQAAPDIRCGGIEVVKLLSDRAENDAFTIQNVKLCAVDQLGWRCGRTIYTYNPLAPGCIKPSTSSLTTSFYVPKCPLFYGHQPSWRALAPVPKSTCSAGPG